MDTVIAVLVRILEVMFILGILGSAVVLVLTSLEDVKSLLPGGDEKKEAAPSRTLPVQPHMHASDPAV
jgi:hypothetical protein